MKKHKGKGKGHTGRIMHKDMGSYAQGGLGQRDPHASSEYHSANAGHGMDHGMSPADMAGDDEEMEGLHGGNCSY